MSGANTFTANNVLLEDTIPSYVNSNEQIDPITSLALLGKGPALFTDCNAKIQCLITVADGTVFEGSQVLNASTGEILDAQSATDIYAVGETPDVAETVEQIIDQYVAPTVYGVDFKLLTDVAEIAGLRAAISAGMAQGTEVNWTASTFVSVDSEDGSQFRQLYDLDSFEPSALASGSRSYLFGNDSVFVIVDAD